MSLATNIAGLRSMSAEQLLGKAGQILPGWVAALIVIAIVWQLAKLTVLLLPQGDATPISLADLPTPTAGGATVSGDVSDTVAGIVAAHIFGEAEIEAVVAPPDEVTQETDLDLTLKGTIAADLEDEARAIIAERTGDEKVYKIGDPIPGNARLHAVYMDRVILRRAGQLEALNLPKADQSQPTRTTRRPTPRRTSTRSISASSKSGSDLQNLIASNPAKLTDIIRPQPVFQDGRQRGYRVYPGRKRQQFNALGLRSGDLVIEINGTALDDPQRGMEVFRSLGESTQVTVTVERNGQPEVLNLDTSILTSQDGDM